MNRREFCVLPLILTGCGGTDVEYPLQPSPGLRESKTVFPSGIFNTVTLTLTATTPGDLTPLTDAARYMQIGNMIFIETAFSGSPTYMTAAGNLIVSGFPHMENLIGEADFSVGYYSAINLAANKPVMTGSWQPGTNYVIFQGCGDNVAPTQVNITDTPSGTAIVLGFQFFYFVSNIS